jgi:hypothetical protein
MVTLVIECFVHDVWQVVGVTETVVIDVVVHALAHFVCEMNRRCHGDS